MSNTNPNYENRVISENELAILVRISRDARKWSQETLANIAQISLRTIQRVEKAEPSNFDTRRALARAFDLGDIDAFNKPHLIPSIEQFIQEQKQLEKDTIAKSVEIVSSGRQLREQVELADAFLFSQLLELTNDAERIFAEMQDYVRDYGDIKCDLSATNKLEVNQVLQRLIDSLKSNGLSIGVFFHNFLIKKTNKNQASMYLNTIYTVIGSTVNFPEIIRVQRNDELTIL